jgi:branched-chain amino acid transport system ATP-binding protein
MNAVTEPASNERNIVLRVEDVVMAFGGLLALRGVSIDVAQGEHLAILGPNGAGKTTLFNVIAGDLKPTRGTVVINGNDMTRRPQRSRAGLGVARTYQKTRLFGGLTVEDNLYLAIIGKEGPRLRPFPEGKSDERREHARAVAGRVWLTNTLESQVDSLSHGQRRQLEVGVALVSDPNIIMLDEPASGLSRGERERLTEMLDDIRGGVTLLLIEHDMDVALKVAHHVIVMADGAKVAEGTPEEIRQNETVRDIYLGTSA